MPAATRPPSAGIVTYEQRATQMMEEQLQLEVYGERRPIK